jgi:hypothetical protein
MISIKAARRAGVPLLAIETSDMQQTIINIVNELNGKAQEIPLLRWDVCRGLVGLNEVGSKYLAKLGDTSDCRQPEGCLIRLGELELPAKTIIFFENVHLYWKMEVVLQAIWNLRDAMKPVGATLIMLAPMIQLPAELKNDVITLVDTLPQDDEINSIIDSILKAAKIKSANDKPKIHDTLLGLSAFDAEQTLAMSITKENDKLSIDMDELWERKRKAIEKTKGLSVWRGGESFEDIGGYDNVKNFMSKICKGQNQPRSIVFIDEINFSVS